MTNIRNKTIGICALCVISAVMLCGCSPKSGRAEEQLSYEDTVNTSETEKVTEASEQPFTSYTFELKGMDSNYMLTVSAGSDPAEIACRIENNSYESRDFVITAPSGYVPVFPLTADSAASCVKIISNDIDNTSFPDLMEFVFYSDGSDDYDEEVPYSISRLYTASDSELREIKIIGQTDEGEKVLDYLDSTMLYHTERDKFISRITVDESALFYSIGEEDPVSHKVKINTLTFDPERTAFISAYERLSEDNPLYFGYACWAAANSAARYFTVSALNVSDYGNYIEISDDDGEHTDYFFRIDDSRFEDTYDLKEGLCQVFSEQIADSLIENAPQKYRDIDGELYGIVGDGGFDTTLGMLTFSDAEITEDRMLFRSRQEKFDENGDFIGYTDGGDFEITRIEGKWIVTKYRFPYSY